MCPVLWSDSFRTCAEQSPQVEPVLRKLRPSGGLQFLELRGVGNEQNLNDFKHGFLKEGGTFLVVDINDNIIREETVSNSNLDTMSKGVRDILQKAGESALVR